MLILSQQNIIKLKHMNLEFSLKILWHLCNHVDLYGMQFKLSDIVR